MSNIIIEDNVLKKIVVIDDTNYIIFDETYSIEERDDNYYSICQLISNESFNAWNDDESKRYYRRNTNNLKISDYDYITIYDANIKHNYYDNIPQLKKKPNKNKVVEKFI